MVELAVPTDGESLARGPIMVDGDPPWTTSTVPGRSPIIMSPSDPAQTHMGQE